MNKSVKVNIDAIMSETDCIILTQVRACGFGMGVHAHCAKRGMLSACSRLCVLVS